MCFLAVSSGLDVVACRNAAVEQVQYHVNQHRLMEEKYLDALGALENTRKVRCSMLFASLVVKFILHREDSVRRTLLLVRDS